MSKQARERLTVVNTRKRLHVLEDGSTDERPVKLYLDTTGAVLFTFLLPEYVTQALNKGDRVTAPTAEHAETLYKNELSAYVQWKRTALAELVIIASIKYEGTTEDGERTIKSKSEVQFGHQMPGRGFDFVRTDKHMIALQYTLAFRVNKDLYERTRVMKKSERFPDEDSHEPVEPPQWKPGARISYSEITRHGTVLPHNDEIVAKLDQVAAAIDQAARILHGVMQAEDVGTALLGLGNHTLRLAA
jgi:hypothetical protein